ncbi:MAG: hypothetical protein SNG73_07570 [Rikenellaceae bacterium]
MKRFYLAVAILLAGCVSDPDVTTVDSGESVSIYGDWYYQGESKDGVEFRSYTKESVINIDNNHFTRDGESIGYNLDESTNTISLDDGSKYAIEELSSSKLTLNDGVKSVVLSR